MPDSTRKPRWTAKAQAAAAQHLAEAPSDHTVSPVAGGRWECTVCDANSENFTPTTEPAEDPPVVKEKTPAAAPIAQVSAYVAWSRVMCDIGAITKADRNTDQNFNFRGIDATMNAVGPVLRAHGVIVLPLRVSIEESERYETRGGTKMHGMVTKHVWRVVGPLGDTFEMETLGQAADAGDKVASKASSVAYRTALLQSLTVPTGDPDPDASSHERAAARPVDPRAEGWDAIKKRGAEIGLSPAEIAADYLARAGHAIDGPQSTVETLLAYYERMAVPPTTDTTSPAGGAAAAAEAPAQDPPAEAPSEPEATRTVDPGPTAQVQGPDRRQALWDDILTAALRLNWTVDEVRADFTSWASGAEGVMEPLEIDGKTTTTDILTRYACSIGARP